MEGSNASHWGFGGFLIGSIFDSSIFPVPIELALIPAVTFDPSNGYWYATACLLGTLIGAPFGYLLGTKGAQSLAKRRWFQEAYDRVHASIERYGAWGIFICGITPFPFPVVTISAGLFGLRFTVFLLAALAGRSVKFYGTAYLLSTFGEAVMQKLELESSIIVGIGIIVMIMVVLIRKVLSTSRNS